MAVRRHHVRAHRLGANEVEAVRQRLPDVPQVSHHVAVPFDDRPDRDAPLDHGDASVLPTKKKKKKVTQHKQTKTRTL